MTSGRKKFKVQHFVIKFNHCASKCDRREDPWPSPSPPLHAGCDGKQRGAQHLHQTKLRCRAIKRQTKWSAPKLTNFEIDVGPSSGTLMKPKNHSMGVGGLLVRELEREKDLKAEKD